MSAKVNIEVFREELLKVMNKPFYIDKAYEIANKGVVEEKNELIKKFDESEVTKELRPGIGGSSLVDRGTLYGFFGFEDPDPSADVKSLLLTIKLTKTSRGARYKDKTIIYEFPLNYPTKQEFIAVTPMPWGTMKSWLIAIEEGLDNFAQYLARMGMGRSKEGIQIKNEIGGSYHPPTNGYVLKWMEEFVAKFGGKFGR